MKIQFSRHARRRAKLYDIDESTVLEILSKMELSNSLHTIIREVTGHKLPLKIIVSVEDKIATVTTNYPLKKGWQK